MRYVLTIRNVAPLLASATFLQKFPVVAAHREPTGRRSCHSCGERTRRDKEDQVRRNRALKLLARLSPRELAALRDHLGAAALEIQYDTASADGRPKRVAVRI